MRADLLKRYALPLMILLMALAVRLAYFNQLQSYNDNFLETAPFCGLDANAYQSRAPRIISGEWPDNTPFSHMILYPFYLAAVYSLAGMSLKLAVMGHILLDVVTCAALYRLARWLFDQETGLLASAMLALYGPLIFYNPCFAQVNLAIPLSLLTLILLVKAKQDNRIVYLAIAGFLSGLAILARPTYLIILPLAWAWLFFRRRPGRQVVIQTLLYLGVVFLVTLPATLHNYRTAGRLSPLPVTSWENIFLGNNPAAEGMGTLDYVLYTYLDLPDETYIFALWQAEKETGTAFREEVIKFVTTQPSAWLDLMGRKADLLLAIPDNYLISPYFLHNLQTVPILTYLPLTWRSIFIGALLGILLVKPRRYPYWLPLLLLTMILLTLAFHIQYRFRLLLVPITIIYAAALVIAAPRLPPFRFWGVTIILGLSLPFLPELGWLLGFFIAAKLIAQVHRHGWHASRWSLLAAWSYLVVALLASQIVAFIRQPQQTQAIFLGPQVTGPIAVGQSFVLPCDGFNQLDLILGDFGNDHSRPVSFHLRATPESETDIFSTTFDPTAIQDRTRYTLTFPAQPNSANQSYFFFITAPDTPPAEAITLRGAPDQPFNRYRAGQTYIGAPGAWQPFAGDLAFAARCEGNIVTVTQQAFQGLVGQWGQGVIFCWGLLISHGLLLLIALFQLWKTQLTRD